MKDFTPLRECARCGQGIGKVTIRDRYCSSDCWGDDYIEKNNTGGLTGKFDVKSDHKGGVFLVQTGVLTK